MTTHQRTQKGAALIIALIMLVMVTLLAVTASRFSLLGTRTSFNFQLDNTVFQAAEVGAIRGVELIENDATNALRDPYSEDPTPTQQDSTLTTGNSSDGQFSAALTVFTSRVYKTSEGESLGQSSHILLNVVSTAEIQDHNARSQIEQGYSIRVIPLNAN